jgi:5'-nucleotidase
MRLRTSLTILALLLNTLALAQKAAVVTILHTNDLHAHPEATTIARIPYGGYARQATLIRKYKMQDPNPILLNAGDTFQGTLYFNAYAGLADLAFMNQVGYNAACVGNHEFDNGPGALGQFAAYANFPVLAANLDLSNEPALKERIGSTAVIKVNDVQIGIVGAVTPDLPNISSSGPTVKMKDLVASVQAGVDDLTKQGINKIVLLTHIGYTEDQDLATKVRGVDVIVGGHSHTPLGTPALQGWPQPKGPYPTVVKGPGGDPVYIVQGYEWGKVLGRLKVHFDAAGKVEKVSEAGPIVIDESIPEEPVVKSMLAAFRKPIDAMSNQPLGTATAEIVRTGDNAMANLITDSMMEATKQFNPDVAFINAGGVRANFDAGQITYGEAIAVQPFGNTLTVIELTGAELLKVLEEGVPEKDKTGGMLYPSAGSSYTVDFTAPAHVKEVVIAGQPLDPAKMYRAVFNNFTAGGGDSHFVLRDLKGKRTDTGLVDLEALIAYIKAHTTVSPSPGRLRRVGG